MEWREDARLAKQGDAAARERLREYMTPFAHGVCIAWAPSHVADRLVPRVLDEVLAALPGFDEQLTGQQVIAAARKASRGSLGGAEEASDDPLVMEAREVISQLRPLTDGAREVLFLRLVEGIPGPELAEVARLSVTDLRGELERAATEASRLLQQPQAFGGDAYLWDLVGTPSPLLASLETKLPALRFDPLAAPAPAPDLATAGTFQELRPVAPAPRKSGLFAENDRTAVGDVGTEPGVVATESPVIVAPQTPPGPNPFEKQAHTIAATDLPVEARAQNPDVPWEEYGTGAGGAAVPAPKASTSARPVPQVSGSEKSGKSSSGKKRADGSSASGRFGSSSKPELTREAPKLVDDDGDQTEAKVPALVQQQKILEELGSPDAVLGKPTMVMPLSSAVGMKPIEHQETRVQPIPAAAQQYQPMPRPDWFKGASPLFLALGLVLLSSMAWGLSIYGAERRAKSNWVLTQVVVAAEDLNIGDTLTVENLALRSVPEPFQGANVVKGDLLQQALDQRLAVAVQAGDPIFFSQFVSTVGATHRLSDKIVKKGRAVSFAISASGAVGQWVRPGDGVDIIFSNTSEIPNLKDQKSAVRAQTILSNVRVMATGKIDSPSSEVLVDEREKKYLNVTVLLLPEEVEVITLAREMGKVTLTLRNEEDHEITVERGGHTDARNLINGERHKALQENRFKIIQSVRKAKTDKK